MLILILIAGAFAFYIMNAEERERVMRHVRAAAEVLRVAALFFFAAARTFIPALRVRHPLARVTAVVLAAAMVFGIARFTRHTPSDVRPEIERLLAAESRITAIYDSATTQFKLGAMSADSLAQLIERRIKPELQVVKIRVMSLDDVPSEQMVLLTKAREYLRLRDESWQRRAEALRRRNMRALRQVETTERASLAALNEAVEAMKQL